jgi:hypothetical protein
MSSMYQAVTALGLRFTLDQLNAAAKAATANSNPEGEESQPQTDHRWHEEQL